MIHTAQPYNIESGRSPSLTVSSRTVLNPKKARTERCGTNAQHSGTCTLLQRGLTYPGRTALLLEKAIPSCIAVFSPPPEKSSVTAFSPWDVYPSGELNKASRLKSTPQELSHGGHFLLQFSQIIKLFQGSPRTLSEPWM